MDNGKDFIWGIFYFLSYFFHAPVHFFKRLFVFFFKRYQIQECGGTITEDLTEIQSPTSDATGGGYMHDLNCTWLIQAPVGKVVELK